MGSNPAVPTSFSQEVRGFEAKFALTNRKKRPTADSKFGWLEARLCRAQGNPSFPTILSFNMKTSSKKSNSVKRIHILYSGSVQGVGFRYTAERLANSLDLRGWVRNLDDGRVEVVCEGPEASISLFIDKIEDVFKGYIRDIDLKWDAATGEFEGFGIRF